MIKNFIRSKKQIDTEDLFVCEYKNKFNEYRNIYEKKIDILEN